MEVTIHEGKLAISRLTEKKRADHESRKYPLPPSLRNSLVFTYTDVCLEFVLQQHKFTYRSCNCLTLPFYTVYLHA